MLRKIITATIILCKINDINAQKISGSENILLNKNYIVVDKNNQLTIRFYKPKAKTVELKGGDAFSNVPVTVQKDVSGYWSIRTSPVDIGFHYFWIEIDKEKYLLPKNEQYYAYNSLVNGFEVDSGEDFFKNKNVPKGTLKKQNYSSKSLLGKRSYYQYYPFDFNKNKTYPLLVLYHGAGENNTGWIKQGKIQNILDHLIAQKKIKPIMVILIEGEIQNSENSDIEASTLENINSLEKDLVDDVLLSIKKKFNISDFYIAGLSRGSFQALKISNDYSHIFSKVGLFSPVIYGGSKEDEFKLLDTKLFKNQFFFIGIGSKEKERYFNFRNSLIKELEIQNTNFKSYESSDTYHEWLTWRRCLYEFLIWLNNQ
ncbi:MULTISPECIES: alpha/beta hydrolase-fold protein [Chryseobacterium]|uniref:alpha/beta hydrolase-fold protein n=1 Tax=Chryseobacterium TaxID=59732 RepID=UPI00195C9E9C|nr:MULTISPECIES: alpha/beta hydrolase-fold protein [Chryseobacterium]MBM7420239.1 enterochelin esterase family protein [Chryseobacterium sp. JUb44]MDH6210182.1 enterochelin esterase-like enzyme [Chryseobacterium sp. BIGb0186]WSO08902.1 alpha/beta hydrolase-fold protein [Chryseobacterium scophthalmum]